MIPKGVLIMNSFDSLRNSRKFRHERKETSFCEIGFYKKCSNLLDFWYIQTIRKNTRFLKISANFVEKRLSCEKFSSLRGFEPKNTANFREFRNQLNHTISAVKYKVYQLFYN